MAGKQLSSQPKITVGINERSFKDSAAVQSSLAVLQKDLNDILAKNPLKANIEVTTSDSFKTIVTDVKNQLNEISGSKIIEFEAQSKNVVGFINSINEKLDELNAKSVIDIKLDPTQVAQVVESIATEMNQQFNKIGGGERALAQFGQTMSAIKESADYAKESMQSVAHAEESMKRNADPAARKISAIGNALEKLQTKLESYSDDANFDTITKGAERAEAVISKMSTALSEEKVGLVGDLDIAATHEAFLPSMSKLSGNLSRDINARVYLTGDLNPFKTAEQIARTIDQSLQFALNQRGATVSLDQSGVVTKKEDYSEQALTQYRRNLSLLKDVFKDLKTYSLGDEVNKWNEQLSRLSIVNTVDAFTLLRDVLAEVKTNLSGVVELMTSSKLTHGKLKKMSGDETNKQATSKEVQSTVGSNATPVKIDVVVNVEQVNRAINAAIAKVDSSKLKKVPVGVEIIGIDRAINKSLADSKQATNSKKTTISFEVKNLKNAINGEIDALNAANGAIHKIKLEFDTSDLTRVVDAGTKAIDAIKTATASAVASDSGSKTGSKAGESKRTPSAASNEMARFRIQQEVDAVKKLRAQFTNVGLSAMQGVDTSSLAQLDNYLSKVETALQSVTNATKEKDKADILNDTTMKQNIIHLKQYAKEVKALYNANSSLFNDVTDQGKYNKAATARQKALGIADDWSKNAFLSRVGLDGNVVASNNLDDTLVLKLRYQADEVNKKLAEIRAEWAKDNPAKEELVRLNNELNTTVKELLRIQSIAETLASTEFADISSPDFVQNYDVAFQKLHNQFAAFEGYKTDPKFAALKIDVGAYVDKLTDAYGKFQQLKNGMGSLSSEEAQKLAQEIAASVSELEQFVAHTKAARAGIAAQTKEQNKVQQEQARINDYVAKYEARLKRFPALWSEIQKIQERAASGVDSEALKREIDSAIRQARALGVENENIFTKIWERVGFNFRSMVASQGMFLVMSSFRDLYNNVKELDAAMTELKKVTDATESAYVKFLDNASERAQRLGASLVDVVKSSSDFARLGYSIKDASALSDAATILLNVGDDVNSIDDATKMIISTMQAFGMTVDDVMGIVNRYNEVANRMPTSAGAIGEGLLRSASALAAAGNTLDESIALFTSGQGVVQNAESLGTVLKTTSMRIRGAETELEEAGLDTDGMADSVSKLRSELMALTGGFDIMKDGGNTFKSTYEILKGISEVWDNLTDVSRANVLEKLAGKRNGNALAAILENFDIAEKTLDIAQNQSDNSALRENEIFLESINGKLSQIAATWESLSNDVLDSSIVKGVLDFLNGTLKVLDSIVKNVGVLPPLIGAVVTALLPLKTTGKNMPPYRKLRQALGCWRSSNRQCEISKSWEQLKLAG